jgi:hypothetical protein
MRDYTNPLMTFPSTQISDESDGNPSLLPYHNLTQYITKGEKFAQEH